MTTTYVQLQRRRNKIMCTLQGEASTPIQSNMNNNKKREHKRGSKKLLLQKRSMLLLYIFLNFSSSCDIIYIDEF